jgi:hypothetical protein
MKKPEELRIVHMFLRDATLTYFKHTPDYPRFKEHCINIFHFVGLNRALMHTAERFYQKIYLYAARAQSKMILNQWIKQLLLEGGLERDREEIFKKYI